MPITTRCPGCSKTIAAPDYAAGHKARCPHCHTVMEIPGASVPVPPHEVVVHEAAMSPAEALAMEARRMAAETAVAAATPPSSAAAGTPSPERTSAIRPGSRSALRSSAVERMIAKTSPYTPLRTLASVVLGVGVVLAVLVLFGGLAAMLFLAVGGHLEVGVAIFGGGIVLGVILGLGAKVVHTLLRLGADVGDRARQATMLLEDLLNRPRDESF